MYNKRFLRCSFIFLFKSFPWACIGTKIPLYTATTCKNILFFNLPICVLFLFFLTLNNVVARSNHTYCTTCCLPGVPSGTALTPMASKYPEDLQHLGYLHYMTRVLYLQRRTAVTAHGLTMTTETIKENTKFYVLKNQHF